MMTTTAPATLQELPPRDAVTLKRLARYADAFTRRAWDSETSYTVRGDNERIRHHVHRATITRLLKHGFITEQPGTQPTRYVITDAGRALVTQAAMEAPRVKP